MRAGPEAGVSQEANCNARACPSARQPVALELVENEARTADVVNHRDSNWTVDLVAQAADVNGDRLVSGAK